MWHPIALAAWVAARHVGSRGRERPTSPTTPSRSPPSSSRTAGTWRSPTRTDSGLWHREKVIFAPGDLGFPAFDTKIGRIGLLICWDIWFPEAARPLAAQDADVICSMNNWAWTPPPPFDEAGRCMAAYLTTTASHANDVVSAADRVTEERGGEFLGCSLITGTNGWPLGSIAYGDLDIVAALPALIWKDLNDLARDRRTDLYDALLGYRHGNTLPR